MAQQTAVEWLIEQIKNEQQNQESLSANEWMEVIEQAKQMEKEQIKEAYNFGLLDEYVTPIELPSDEEIEKHFTIGVAPQTSYPHMIQGAKWMRDKILNK